jgi:ABC-type multidrug transport system ATPase subunit/peptidoglycan/LPS O-acetylase OafA/YrhL
MTTQNQDRIHALDAVRAFALLLGIAFHATMSFLPGMTPGAWAAVDNSPSTTLGVMFFTSHMFRMSLFFVMAGFFAHLMLQRRGVRGFWNDRLKRIGVPLIVGWLLIFPMVAVLLIFGIKRTFAGVPPQNLPHMPAPPRGYFPLAHFWFLYYLLMLYAIVFAVRELVERIDGAGRVRTLADRCVAFLTSYAGCALFLGVPLAIVLYRLPGWQPGAGIPTPDMTVIPQLPALVGYGTAFGFGWLLHRQPRLLTELQRRDFAYVVLAVALTVICLAPGTLFPGTGLHAAQGLAKLGYVAAYVGAIWAWTFGIVGLALRYLNHESPVRRYLADSSYWLYLTHLPPVMAMQILVAPLHVSWVVKYPLILAVTFAILLSTYHFLVRPTFIGQLLNGRKYPRRRNLEADRASSVPQVAARPVEVLAELRGACKRYGKITALDGLDLEVRRGELLALLGPNGAGKSTAIALWLGLTEPDAGGVKLLGRSPQDVESRRGIGVMMQEVTLSPGLRVRELVELTRSYYPEPLPVRRVLEMTGAEPLAARPYGKLSGGQKRQAQFAMAVCGRPELLFLDEPTVGLDIQAREAMWRVIRDQVARGCSVVLTTHYLEEAEALADRVAVLSAGRLIAAGTVDEIRSVVSRKEIRCTSSLGVECVRQWPGITQARRDAKRLHLTAIDAETVVRQLLLADPNLRDLEVRQAGLAEAFAELTKEAA